MTTPTVPTSNNIRPNQIVIVQGAVAFARTASLISGAELARRVANSKSSYPTDNPHSLIVLSQCKVVPADPAQLTWEEAYVQSLFFENKKSPEKGLGYEAKNLTSNLPTLLAVDPDNPGAYRQVVDVEGEIARGTVVKIVVQTFQSKDKFGKPRDKLGVGLEAIILPTPEVPYAPRSGARNLDLSSYGITVSEPLVATNGVEIEAANEGPNDHIVGTDASGLPAAPVAQPAAAAPAPAAPVAAAAPVAPAAPAALLTPPVAASPAAPAAPVAPAAPAAPVAPTAPVQPIVPVAAAYQVAAPGAPVAPAVPVGNPDDPFAAAPAPQWAGAGIQAPA
ncbi:MAG: hypothetical protein DI630_00160 [Gordonia sp. (in: high G+C Gram-positive bacteria)]|nr:MAG: hypothetical protein DI630_00160 [Gordonia sp. (in: high G+C Gram-positive bacteria)]